MKTIHFVFWLATAGGVGVLIGRLGHPQAQALVVAAGESAPPPIPSPNATPTRSKQIPAGFSWASIETTNYAAFVANLRRIGCPEVTVRDILVPDLLGCLNGASGEEDSIWNVLLSRFPDRAKAQTTVMQANALLGRQALSLTETPSNEVPSAQPDANNRGSTLTRMEAEIAMRTAAVWERLGTNPPSEADLHTLRELQAERQTALQEILSASELARYEAESTGALADGLVNYGELNLSESETLQLLQLENAHVKSLAALSASHGKVLEPQSSDTELGIRRLLGEERYPLYERLQAPEYAQLRAFALGEQLPLDRLAQVYDQLRSTGEIQNSQIVANQLSQQFGGGIGQRWLALAEQSEDPASSQTTIRRKGTP